MSDDVLDQIAEDIKNLKPKLDRARDLIEAAREAGEDVTALQSQLNDLEMRKARWVRMLRRRGYIFDESD